MNKQDHVITQNYSMVKNRKVPKIRLEHIKNKDVPNKVF